MASSRFPGKPMHKINGTPMIEMVWQQVKKVKWADSFIACCDAEIFSFAKKIGANVVMTDPSLPSGSDRVYQAYKILKKDNKLPNCKYIINAQGDIPKIPASYFTTLFEMLNNYNFDIYTLGLKIKNEADKCDPNIVKIHMSNTDKVNRALSFSRAKIPFDKGDIFEHIGIYLYKISALKTFINANVTQLEQRERLEQLRALELGLSIGVSIVKQKAISIDTVTDLDKL